MTTITREQYETLVNEVELRLSPNRPRLSVERILDGALAEAGIQVEKTPEEKIAECLRLMAEYDVRPDQDKEWSGQAYKGLLDIVTRTLGRPS